MDVDNSISDPTAQSAGTGSRFNDDPSKIVYKNLYQFRMNQSQDGVDLSGLTDVMWGLVPLHRCHHVSCVTNTNHSAKRSPTQANTPESDFPLTTYRVRICKTCCGETGHIELGTYNDQESAMLVNDAFEIMQGRYNRLLVLRPEDQQYFDRLYVQRCDRSKGKEQVGLLEVIAERRRHSTSQSTSSSTVASLESRKRSSPASGLSFNDLGSSAKRQARSALSSSASVTSEESTSRPSSKGDNVGTKFPANQNDEDYSDDEDSSSSPASLEEAISSSTAMDTQDIVSPPLVKQEPRISPNSALKLMDDNAHPNLGRQRSYTFSTASEYFPALNSMQSGIETLTWLASLDEREVDVARSLFALAHQEYPSSAEESSRSGAEEISKVAATSVPVTSTVQRERSDSYAEMMGEKNTSKPASAKKQVVIMTPRKDSVTSEDGEGQEFAVVDRLSLLTRSAGLLASPVQRNGYPIVLSPLRSLGQAHSFSGLDDPPILPPSSYRRPRSQSMSAIDPPNNGFNSTNGINAANILKSNVNDPHALPIMRVLHQSHTHLLLQSMTGAGLRGEGFIGIYSPEERKIRIERFLEKRKHRMWLKKVKYDVRKNFADSRVRIKGRFVKKEEEKIAMLMSVTDEKSTSSTAVSTPASAKRAEAKGRGSKEPAKPVVNQADYDDDEDDDE